MRRFSGDEPDVREESVDGAGTTAGRPSRAVVIGACVLGAIAVGLVLLRSMVILPWYQGVHAWVIPLDAWTPVGAARYVGNGDVFHLYEPLAGRTGYPYTPGLPILLAPFVAIGDHFHLLGDVFFTHSYPGMFVLVGPADAFLGTLAVALAAGFAVDGPRRRVWTVQALVFVVATWAPVGFLHPEDSIVTALLIASCVMIERGSWRGSGALAGVALLFKQWAAWPALVCVALAPPSKRANVAFYAYALPALMMVPFLVASPATYSSLAGTRATLELGQPQFWTSMAFGHAVLVNATFLRAAWGAAGLAIALRARHRSTCDSALAAMCTIMLARLVFEPVVFGYYLVPPTVLALVWCARNGERLGLRAVCASLLCGLCLLHTLPEGVLIVFVVSGLAYVCGPAVRAWWTSAEHRTQSADDGAGSVPAHAPAPAMNLS